MGGRQQAYLEAIEHLRSVARPAAAAGSRATVDQAVGLLAGRTRCRLADAHRHLLRMAADQNRDVADVAAGVIGMLDIPEPADDRGPAGARDAARPAAGGRRDPGGRALARRSCRRSSICCPASAPCSPPSVTTGGRLTDLIFAAAGPGTVVLDGRRGRQLIGARMAEQFPETLASDRWADYERVLQTGEPVELGPFPYGEHRYTARAHRLGSGLFVTWVQHGTGVPARATGSPAPSSSATSGWGEWDLVSGEVDLVGAALPDLRTGPGARPAVQRGDRGARGGRGRAAAAGGRGGLRAWPSGST